MRTTPDARTLGAAAQQLLRRQVVQGVRGGMTQTAAARTYGASLRAVSHWVRLDRRGGLRALTLKRRGRRVGGGLLNEKQSARIRALIVDGHPVHRSAVVTRFVARHTTRLRLIRLPGYCPELNPDELLNQDVKTNGLGRSRPANRTELLKTVRGHLHRRQKQPQVIKTFFQEQQLRYAA